MRVPLGILTLALGCVVANCGAPTSRNPTCFPGGQQVLFAPYPGSTSFPPNNVNVYIASSVTLDPNDYRVALSPGHGVYLYGNPARQFGPVPSPTPRPGETAPP